jgi:hypothetical protein
VNSILSECEIARKKSISSTSQSYSKCEAFAAASFIAEHQSRGTDDVLDSSDNDDVTESDDDLDSDVEADLPEDEDEEVVDGKVSVKKISLIPTDIADCLDVEVHFSKLDSIMQKRIRLVLELIKIGEKNDSSVHQQSTLLFQYLTDILPQSPIQCKPTKCACTAEVESFKSRSHPAFLLAKCTICLLQYLGKNIMLSNLLINAIFSTSPVIS